MAQIMTLHTNFDWSLNVEHFISFSLGIRDEDFPVLHFYGVQLGHILLKIFFVISCILCFFLVLVFLCFILFLYCFRPYGPIPSFFPDWAYWITCRMLIESGNTSETTEGMWDICRNCWEKFIVLSVIGV